MGGCASRPKDLDVQTEAAPSEAPDTPTKAEGNDCSAQENKKEECDESEDKEPSVDLSDKPKKKKEECCDGEEEEEEEKEEDDKKKEVRSDEEDEQEEKKNTPEPVSD